MAETYYDLDLVSVEAGATEATAEGAVLEGLVRENDELVINGISARLLSGSGGTGNLWNLVLKDPWPGETVVGVPGYVRTKPDAARFTEDVTTFIAMLVQMGVWLPTEGIPNDLVGKDGDVAFDPDTLTFYRRVEGEWEELFRFGYVGDVNPIGEWDSATSYNLKDLVGFEGASYISLVADNINFEPPSNPTKWMLFARGTTVDEVLDELGVHKITISTDNPSGGQHGDLWFKVPV